MRPSLLAAFTHRLLTGHSLATHNALVQLSSMIQELLWHHSIKDEESFISAVIAQPVHGQPLLPFECDDGVHDDLVTLPLHVALDVGEHIHHLDISQGPQHHYLPHLGCHPVSGGELGVVPVFAAQRTQKYHPIKFSIMELDLLHILNRSSFILHYHYLGLGDFLLYLCWDLDTLK